MTLRFIQILVSPQRWNKIQKIAIMQLVMENLVKHGANRFIAGMCTVWPFDSISLFKELMEISKYWYVWSRELRSGHSFATLADSHCNGSNKRGNWAEATTGTWKHWQSSGDSVSRPGAAFSATERLRWSPPLPDDSTPTRCRAAVLTLLVLG